METEEYFPRGGARPPALVQRFRQSANFLGKPEKVARKKKRSKKPSADDGYPSDEFDAEYERSGRTCAMGLHYGSIKAGMVVLARVRETLDTKLFVSLPSRLQGVVMACHVSEPHNRSLQAYVDDRVDSVRELRTMFRRGQYVAVKVLEVQNRQLMLSTMPQHVNTGRTHLDIKKGVLLQGAVSSVEDHGYVIDVGIPKSTVFLPKTMAHEDIELGVGQLTWCAVKKCASEADSSVVTVTNKLQSLQDSFIKYRESDSRSVHTVLPGTALEFLIDKPLRNGIEGRIFNNIAGYIQRQHADSTRAKKPRLGEKIRARLLYVMPTSNVPFLSMKNIFETAVPDLEKEQRFKDGDVVHNAKVLAITGRSIIFKLGELDTGMLTVKRVMVDEDLTDEDVISKSYPLGSVHQTRIICYNLCDYTYWVSDEAAILDEKYFSWADVAVGDIVDATVKIVNDNNLVLSVGRLTGIVQQMHISDLGVFVDPKKASNAKLPKKKFKVGQPVKARVLIADQESNKLQLTLKPSLMETDLEIITQCEQAVVGKSYRGFIKYVDEKILVGFFNNVTALIPPVYVSREKLPALTDAFHAGQIVNCTILKVRPDVNRIIGSLTTPPFVPSVNGKRPKHNQENTEESQGKKIHIDKKRRTASESSDTSNSNKKKKRLESLTCDYDEDVKNKNKRNKKKSDLEASDHTELDLLEATVDDLELPILTPDELTLGNFEDCVTKKHFKKRIVSLTKALNNRIRRLSVIESKLEVIEEKGIDAKNKKLHTAMNTEKIIMEDRMKHLLEALKTAQDKLKDFGDEDVKKDYKVKKQGSIPNSIENMDKSDNVAPKIKKKAKKGLKTIEDKENKCTSIEMKVADSTVPALEVPSVKDFWSLSADTLAKNVNEATEEASSSSDEEVEEQPKKKRKKLSAAEKVEKVRQEEERLRALERSAALDADRPQSSDQFERLLLANPNSSELWIAYMAFYLQATEIEKARAVGRKALKTISFREEQEKLNVWLAMLNFENRFGTKESLENVLEEALQMNDSFKVHSKLLEMYQETSKVQELTSLVDLMMKKYKRDPTAYTMAGNALYKLGLVDKARSIMQKANSILDKKDHISVMVQFALLERALGSAERAEALLEQVVGAYPQRTDVWSVYVDMLYKANDIDNIRQVMERAVSHKMAARKMKVLYQKWIEVEEKMGDAEQVARILQKALDFIEKAKF